MDLLPFEIVCEIGKVLYSENIKDLLRFSSIAKRYRPIIKIITKLNAVKNMQDFQIRVFINLTNLNCGNNENFTDNGISVLTNLTYLSCGRNILFTDDGISVLINLINLNCGNNFNLTKK